jgi:hypothetical protein
VLDVVGDGMMEQGSKISAAPGPLPSIREEFPSLGMSGAPRLWDFSVTQSITDVFPPAIFCLNPAVGCSDASPDSGQVVSV